MKAKHSPIVMALCLGLLVPTAALAQKSSRSVDLTRAPKQRPALDARDNCTLDPMTERAFPCRTGEVVQDALVFPDGSMEIVRYELIDGVGVFDGDILLPVDAEGKIDQPVLGPDGILSKSTGRSSTSYRWPGANVPYVNSLTYNTQRVADAIAHWESVTNLRFVPRTTQSSYVDFVPSTGCSSFVGRQGGRQEIRLADACSTGNTIHEIGHASGLWHEHNRSDRDNTITIHWQNIETCGQNNFETYVQRGEDGFDWGPHDFGSIMHYGSNACSLNGPTITKKDGSTFSAQRNGLSQGDLSGVDKMYGLRVQISHWCTEYSRECHFSVYVTQGPTSLQSIEWFFDDTPQTQFGQSVDHTFSTYGWHHVEVEVFDDRGDRVTDVTDVFLDENETCIICS